jgi:hypothetical protein
LSSREWVWWKLALRRNQTESWTFSSKPHGEDHYVIIANLTNKKKEEGQPFLFPVADLEERRPAPPICAQ